jgi:hypothetical protein
VCPFYRLCSWKKKDVISHDFPCHVGPKL